MQLDGWLEHQTNPLDPGQISADRSDVKLKIQGGHIVPIIFLSHVIYGLVP